MYDISFLARYIRLHSLPVGHPNLPNDHGQEGTDVAEVEPEDSAVHCVVAELPGEVSAEED